MLVAHNPQWPVQAEQLLAQLRQALAAIVDVGMCTFDHIGSTAVPGLDAWLAADYQRLKQQLAAAHSGDPDYDDYTRGKTTFIHTRFARDWQCAMAGTLLESLAVGQSATVRTTGTEVAIAPLPPRASTFWPREERIEFVRGALGAGEDHQLVTLRLPQEQHAELRQWCADHNFSMAAVIRGLVDQFLRAQRAAAAAASLAAASPDRPETDG